MSTKEQIQYISEQMLTGNYNNYTEWNNALKIRSQKQIHNWLEPYVRQAEHSMESGDDSEGHAALFLASFQLQIAPEKLDYKKIIDLLEQAVAMKNTNAMCRRAYMHQVGLGGAIDYPKAILLYDMAVAKGNAVAMNNRALMHKWGYGGSVDYSTAIKLYEMAIARGGMGGDSALFNLALMHQEGLAGHPVNYLEAIRLYDMAIARGNPAAMNNRANMHQLGQGDLVNYPEAIRLYEIAIAKGYKDAAIIRAALHQQARCENEAEAGILLGLQWKEIVTGAPLTPNTLKLFGIYCRKQLLARIINPDNDYLEVSLETLEEICKTGHHIETILIKDSTEYRQILDKKNRVLKECQELSHANLLDPLTDLIKDYVAGPSAGSYIKEKIDQERAYMLVRRSEDLTLRLDTLKHPASDILSKGIELLKQDLPPELRLLSFKEHIGKNRDNLTSTDDSLPMDIVKDLTKLIELSCHPSPRSSHRFFDDMKPATAGEQTVMSAPLMSNLPTCSFL